MTRTPAAVNAWSVLGPARHPMRSAVCDVAHQHTRCRGRDLLAGLPCYCQCHFPPGRVFWSCNHLRGVFQDQPEKAHNIRNVWLVSRGRR